ncbi:hypothetical protein J1N09_03100 [Aureitalea sp. L0-47]|uniref:hypothetical protein n=1 Tax=Aureitalea sp. L0-47 TaxID=2816962 RepID=UPI0022371B99|nr:hypothetical protein [Aureitalea sp. L0-47]MCW5518809.1 hypothetical protein [Aureitalea sp. L0-47]
MKELIQKKNFITREYRLGESKLFFYKISYGNGDEMDIPYENIDGEKVRANNNSYITLLLGIGGLLFGVLLLLLGMFVENLQTGYLGIVSLLFGIPVIGYYWLTKEKLWKIKLSNGTYLHFHQSIPSPITVEEFINELITTRDKYLLDNYGTIDKNLGYEEQLSNFKWLKSIRVISNNEFDNKVIELRNVVDPEKFKIGFGK